PMVKWRGRKGSENVEGRRGAAAGMSGLLILLLRFVFSRFGFGGIIVLVGGFFALRAIGVDPLALLAGQQQGSTQISAEDQEAYDFSSVVLAETEKTWTEIFTENGAQYQPQVLVVYTGQTQTGCGYGSAAAGPFYCPLDRKVYLDTSFFRELSQRFGASGDFAGAYVIAHEVGHHVQTITGIADDVRQAQSRASQEAQNQLQVMMELQADCYAGLWARHADKYSGFLDDGDIEEGLRAAAAIGDDTLQKNAGRRVTPESFTHGSSEQRVRWFTIGYRQGDVGACDTFNAGAL
ncbi:MAG TPA: neutral zinc metallopeptidase, partial [Parvularculaceae bacterium]|nr:neutral zinc metallopeptidase [Parvularculaceae bacterium]